MKLSDHIVGCPICEAVAGQVYTHLQQHAGPQPVLFSEGWEAAWRAWVDRKNAAPALPLPGPTFDHWVEQDRLRLEPGEELPAPSFADVRLVRAGTA